MCSSYSVLTLWEALLKLLEDEVEFSKSFSIPKTINGAAGYAEPMKLEGCVLTEIIARI